MDYIDVFNNRTDRIMWMERYLDEIVEIYTKEPDSIKRNKEIQHKIKILEDYYDSGLWLRDYEADERGELPPDLKRGVLAEDTIYNLLYDLNHIDEIE